MQDMDATSSADLVHTQVHPRRPWRTQGPRPSVRGSKGRRRKKRQLLQAPDIRPQPGHSGQPPEIRRPSQNAPEAEPHQPGHPVLPEPPDIRPLARTSGPRLSRELRDRPLQPGNPAPITERPEAGSRQPRHPASRESPDIRHVARTSGPSCLRAVYPGRKPMYPFAP